LLEGDFVFFNNLPPIFKGDSVVWAWAGAGILSESDHFNDGIHVVEEELVALVKVGGNVTSFVAVNLARSVFGFVSVEAELVNSSDGGFEHAPFGDLGLHLGDVLGVEHDQSGAGVGKVVVNGDTLFDECEGFARASDGVDDKMAGALVDEVNTEALFASAVRGKRRGCGGGEVEGDVHELSAFKEFQVCHFDSAGFFTVAVIARLVLWVESQSVTNDLVDFGIALHFEDEVATAFFSEGFYPVLNCCRCGQH